MSPPRLLEQMMSVAYWCVLFAALLPYPIVMFAKAGQKYDNHAPREQLEHAQGSRKRAYWAQLNAFEAFPAFAAAIIIAQLQHVAQSTVDHLALVFVAMRVLHALFYVLDKAPLRSMVWAVGIGCVITLFVLAGTR
ncbi:MAG: MAPEG family protein [Sulfuriferula sp.]|nr:MAPEG family protein [Sulfuriferula sp.]